MTPALAILHQLAKRSARPQCAAALMEVLGLDHDDCYTALIGMESHGLVALARECTAWRITGAGESFLDWTMQ